MEKAAVTLVTGGAGFIGSHLCQLLLSQDKQVLCVDSLTTGRNENIQPFLSNKNFRFIQADIRDKAFLKSLEHEHISRIFEMASPASVDYVTEHPIEAATVNSLGLYNVLEYATLHKSRILFASSSEVYGDPKEHPQTETYWGNVNSIGIRSGYDEGKRFGEALVMAYKREKKIDTRVARIFNTYGPNSSKVDGRVIPRFIRQALNDGAIPVHGDGKQTRSFCYVSDLVDGLIKLMDSNETNPVNLGNPAEMTINDIAHKIIDMTGSKSKIAFQPRPQDDPSRRTPDIRLAQEKLDWKPKISIEAGLTKTIIYFRTHL